MYVRVRVRVRVRVWVWVWVWVRELARGHVHSGICERARCVRVCARVSGGLWGGLCLMSAPVLALGSGARWSRLDNSTNSEGRSVVHGLSGLHTRARVRRGCVGVEASGVVCVYMQVCTSTLVWLRDSRRP